MFTINVPHFLKYDYRTRFALFLFVLFWGIFFLFFFSQYFRPHLLKVSFYNVGQGDAVFIETPERYQILMDGGPGPAVLEEIAKDMPFYDRTIDLVIPTHPDADHIAGLIDVFERYDVKTVALPYLRSDTLISKRLLRTVAGEHSNIKEAVHKEFQKIELPGDVHFEIVNPRQSLRDKSENDASVVSLLSYGNITFLFLADIGAKKEREIIPLLPQGIDVLKIAHHGAKSSLNSEFFRAVSPELSVIPVGENRYGHPSREVIAALESIGSRVWRTDRDGTLTILSDGKKYWVK